MKTTAIGAVIALTTILAACGGAATPAAPQSSPAPASAVASPATSSKPAATSPPASAKPAASSSSAAAEAKPSSGLVKMTVSYPEGGAHLPLWYAKDKGIFAKNGLNVELTALGGGPPALAALTTGQTQVADITGSVISSANAAGADVLALATLDPVYPYVLEVNSTVKAPGDLKGKQIAVRAFGDATDIAARVALKKLNLAPDKDVQVIEVNTEGARMATVLAGRACCTVAQPQDRPDLESSGFHQLLDFSTLGLKNAQGVISVQRSYASANKANVQKFMASVLEAIQAEKQDKPGSLALMKKYLKVDDAKATTLYDYFVGQVIPVNPTVTADQFTDGIAILATKNPKMNGFTMDKFIDNGFLSNR